MVKLFEDKEAGGFRYEDEDWRISAYEAPSGNGITCHIFTRHYPFTSVAIRGIRDIQEAEEIAAVYTLTH